MASSDTSRPSFASRVNAAIARAGGDPVLPLALEEQSEDWLDAVPENIQRSTTEVRVNVNAAEDQMDIDDDEKMAQDQATRMKSLAEKIEKFVEGQGTLEGATFEEYVRPPSLSFGLFTRPAQVKTIQTTSTHLTTKLRTKRIIPVTKTDRRPWTNSFPA